MPWFEDKLRPTSAADPSVRDAIGVGLLIAVLLVLRPRWRVDEARFVTDVAGQLLPFFLLPAMAMALALRRGAIDLSVWASAAMGGVVAAACVRAGLDVRAATLAAAGGGLAFGAVNAAAVALLRVPSPVATLATGLVLMWGLQATSEARAVEVSSQTSVRWHLVQHVEQESTDGEPSGFEGRWLPLAATRMAFVGGAFAITLLAALAVHGVSLLGWKPPDRWALFAVLCASGALASLGGVAWLLEHGRAPIPTRLIGDLRVVAAAALAGPLLLAARGRSALVVLCMPFAALAATLWRQYAWAWDMQYGGYALQALQLAAMALVAQRTALRAAEGSGRRVVRLAPAAAAGAGLLLVAAAGRDVRADWITRLYVAGTALSGLGLMLAILIRPATRSARSATRRCA